MKTTLTLFLLLLSLPAHAAGPLWQEMQGRWRGTVRVQESSCKVTNLSQKIDLRVRPRSEAEETLSGRTANRRYVGYVLEPDTFDDGLSVQFYASKPYRMKDGRVCKLVHTIDFFHESGDRAYVEAGVAVVCFGRVACRTRSAGVLKKTVGRGR